MQLQRASHGQLFQGHHSHCIPVNVAKQALSHGRGRLGLVRAQAGPSSAPQRELLRELCSIGDDTYNRANQIHSGLLEKIETGRMLPVVNCLLSKCQLTSRELQLILIRHPKTFSYTQEHIVDVLSFLEAEVGLNEDQLRAVVTRFPQVFSFSVKAHLKPQLPYLLSLGIEQHQLADYVTARPMLLGEGIETVIRFLKMCGLPRKQLAQLLRTYPIDYCCRFVFKKSDIQPGTPPPPETPETPPPEKAT